MVYISFYVYGNRHFGFVGVFFYELELRPHFRPRNDLTNLIIIIIFFLSDIIDGASYTSFRGSKCYIR